jgi:hypothetical protein
MIEFLGAAAVRRVETFRRETMDWTATPMREQLGMMRRVAFFEWKLL